MDMRGYFYRKRGPSVCSKNTSLDNENEEGTLVTQQEKRKNIYSNNAINNLQVSSSSRVLQIIIVSLFNLCGGCLM